MGLQQNNWRTVSQSFYQRFLPHLLVILTNDPGSRSKKFHAAFYAVTHRCALYLNSFRHSLARRASSRSAVPSAALSAARGTVRPTAHTHGCVHRARPAGSGPGHSLLPGHHSTQVLRGPAQPVQRLSLAGGDAGDRSPAERLRACRTHAASARRRAPGSSRSGGARPIRRRAPAPQDSRGAAPHVGVVRPHLHPCGRAVPGSGLGVWPGSCACAHHVWQPAAPHSRARDALHGSMPPGEVSAVWL